MATWHVCLYLNRGTPQKVTVRAPNKNAALTLVARCRIPLCPEYATHYTRQQTSWNCIYAFCGTKLGGSEWTRGV
jgi:hypothetical protein